MAHRDRSPVHVPLRTSSRNMLRSGAMDGNEEPAFVERKTSKAHRILGTDLPPQQQPRRQSLRTPDSTSGKQRQHSGFVPFPALGESTNSPQNLRVRASSPLLGHDFQSHSPAPPLPKSSKKVRESGSSSNLFSYFSSKESSSKSTPTTPNSHSLQPKVRNALQAEPQVTYTRNSPKESKRKLRPPRIDLSILFPRPRNPTPQNPLLSPQRMTNSPSPVSTVVSDYPNNRLDRARSNSTARKLQVGEPLPAQNEATKPSDRSDLLSIPESKDGEWSPRSFEPPLERTVGTSEIDLALDRYAGRRSLISRSSVYTASREQLRPDQNRPNETIAQRRAHSPVGSSRPQELYLSPRSKPDAGRSRTNSNTHSTKTTMTNKSSRSTLKNQDLQNTSILCLSSSEDEESEQETTPTEEQRSNKKRESVATYGEYEPEIYTAATAQTATVGTPTLKKFERESSTSSPGSNPASQSQSRARHVSTSSAGKSSTTTRRTNQSRRSSQIPSIAEPDILDKFPQRRRRTPQEQKAQELKEINRRSRVITVTRQEQDLLEAMRQRKGKITPSLFNYNPGTESNRNSVVPDVPDVPDLPDRSSVVSGPSRDSFCGSDTSFLRLSAAFPPFHARPEQGATPSQASSSDTEPKTGNSIASPQFSTGYSESLPSPATSGASPLTPTLPLHRFSPLPSPKPPPRGPPPAIPEDQKQHARRRTDSSEAIMLNESGDPRRKHDLPLWSFDFDWNHDQTNVAAVH